LDTGVGFTAAGTLPAARFPAASRPTATFAAVGAVVAVAEVSARFGVSVAGATFGAGSFVARAPSSLPQPRTRPHQERTSASSTNGSSATRQPVWALVPPRRRGIRNGERRLPTIGHRLKDVAGGMLRRLAK
jgi:hypothetical protein